MAPDHASPQAKGTDQEGPPRRPAKEPAESAEKQTVGGSETGPLDLSFQDAELVAECQNLDLECSFGLPAEDKEVEQ